MSLNLKQQYSSSKRLVGLGSEKVILNVSHIPEWLGEFSKLVSCSHTHDQLHEYLWTLII